MSKPFNIQSPEQIAKEYAGNKQKIAEAMQMGVVDPTAGVLAGMFIDRMRSAQMQEQAPQTTVAQQVMGGLPPVPPQVQAMAPQGGAPVGLGAIPPQGGDVMTEMPAPEMAVPEEAPMGMAMGGIAGLPVPDDMFDEPTNGGYDDGYAGGGLVAFAGGGPARRSMTDEEYLAYIMKKESGGRDYDAKGRPLTSKAGAKYAMQVLDSTARSPGFGITPARNDSPEEYNRVGREYALALRKQFGDEGGAAAYNMGPGAYQAFKAGKRGMPAETRNYIAGLGGAALPERNQETAQGRFGSLLDQMAVVDELYSGLPEDKGRKEAIEYYEKQRSPEQREKARKDDMWATLAQIGASMAGTSSPNFLQAVGQAIGAALPGAEASRKERKAMEREAVTALSELYGMDRKEAKEKMNMALDLRNIEMGAEEKQTERQFRANQAAIERRAAEDAAALAFERQMELAKLKDKGVDELAEQFYQMGKNEKLAKGLPVDEPALRATAMVKAMKVKAELSPQGQQTDLFGATGVRPAGAQGDNTLDFSQLK